MKKFAYYVITVIVILLVVISFNINSKATLNDDLNNVYLFYGEGCTYCESLKKHLDTLPISVKNKFNLVEYEVWNNTQNSELMQNFANYFNEEADGVPYLVIGDKSFIGYSNKYDEEIMAALILLEETEIDIKDLTT